MTYFRTRHFARVTTVDINICSDTIMAERSRTDEIFTRSLADYNEKNPSLFSVEFFDKVDVVEDGKIIDEGTITNYSGRYFFHGKIITPEDATEEKKSWLPRKGKILKYKNLYKEFYPKDTLLS